ncbi:FAD:protein FMN transferase [Variovorax ginsengisoli]|uniref:FAD:protein FMN transferase n=1 Tax=Variovorax ginsengisoli TaxID=363844 RepID=A0ABT9S6G0_9BURK|nr:FAD:protein FMN transferase [Variovorax ginsengisoli]MDP9899946.1 thiamine biosynthesis lipoprotein [Variovorax ginsengisoli]
MNAAARPNFATWPAGGYANVALARRADPSRLQTLSGRTMGTTWTLKFDNPQMRPLAPIAQAVEQALAQVIEQMSTWEPDSDISRYGRATPGSRCAVPPEFAQVLDCALHWAQASGGAIDPTVGPLVAWWGFGAEAQDPPAWPLRDPRLASLADARARVGWHRIAFDRNTRTVLQPGGMALDFSGVAKGFAVDHVVAALQAMEITQLLMEVGGELRGVGRRPDGSAWQVQVDAGDAPAPRIALADLAIATSGDRWHGHTQGGRRWSHTIDPRTGEPASAALASVSVLHAQCMHADALATALTVLGPVDGPAFADAHAVAALFVCRDGHAQRLLASTAWHTHLALGAAPR